MCELILSDVRFSINIPNLITSIKTGTNQEGRLIQPAWLYHPPLNWTGPLRSRGRQGSSRPDERILGIYTAHLQHNTQKILQEKIFKHSSVALISSKQSV